MDKFFQHGDTLSVIVASRPVTEAPKFGAWLELKRGDRSLEQIAQRVRPLVREAGLKVDQSLIYKIEQGRVPSWPMLAALAHVYEVAIEEATQRLMQAVQFPGSAVLICQTIDPASGLPGGPDPNVSSPAAPPHIQPGPTPLEALQNVVDIAVAALEAAGRQPVHLQDARARKTQPRARRRAAGHR